jgi:hypothetical protein
MIKSINLLHQGHEIGKAFNSMSNGQKSVMYCKECAGDFHGCYCEDLENCLNCEIVSEFQFI